MAEHQKDWDQRLPEAMAAYRASRHDSTGYSPNRLLPVDIVYGAAKEEPAVDYDGYAGALQQNLVTAYEEVRKELRTADQRYNRYYDIKVRPHRYKIGQWVYYFNPRKYAGRQDKWLKKFSGPFLITVTPTPVNVVIQRSARAKPLTVHLDKIKPYIGPEPVYWLKPEVMVPSDNSNATAPVMDDDGPLLNPVESEPSNNGTDSPQIKTPGVRPRRMGRLPGYLAGYEWKNRVLTSNDIQNR